MKTLNIDIETYSSNSIQNGVYKYIESDDFEIILFSYSIDFQPAKTVDLLSGEKIPQLVINAIDDKNVLKLAYNAQFEITCLSKHFNKSLDYTQWYCTMVYAAQCGLPFGLDNVSKVLNTVEKKDAKGKALIKYFCEPCKPTKTNNFRTRNFPEHEKDKWTAFKEYNKQDVETEKAVFTDISWFKICDFEKDMWWLDQKINRRGVYIDLDLVKQSLKIDAEYSDYVLKEIQDLTGIDNPKSNTQVKAYILEKTGMNIASLSKAEDEYLTNLFKENAHMLKVLDLRKRISRASIKKYTALINSVSSDNVVRGLFQYYGARTGRWSGRNVQLQNLKSNYLSDLEIARNVVKTGKLDTVSLLYDDPGEVLSNLVRTVFIPRTKYLMVSDFSAIEARITAWFAKEEWRLEVFRSHGKIYEASASKMFKIPIESVTKEIRNKGKVAELALGYQGGLGALQRMGGSKMGLSDIEMTHLVKQWRNSNKNIVKLWYDVERYIKQTILDRTEKKCGYLRMAIVNNNLLIYLPSGRALVYRDIRLIDDQIMYSGINDIGQWSVQKSYGGKFIENIVQATARDVLANALKNINKEGFNIVMHVHDEIVIEIDNKEDVDRIKSIITAPISWLPGLPLKEETFISTFYKK